MRGPHEARLRSGLPRLYLGVSDIYEVSAVLGTGTRGRLRSNRSQKGRPVGLLDPDGNELVSWQYD